MGDKILKISLLGVSADYCQSVFPLIIERMGYKIKWVLPDQCDLLIVGPFFNKSESYSRFIPHFLRRFFKNDKSILSFLRANNALVLFHTQENMRYNTFNANYTISFDLGVSTPNHFRFPYWMDLIDWSHEGISGNQNHRYGRLLNINRLLQPLGEHFLKKPRIAGLFSSHLLEPRLTLLHALEACLPVHKYGCVFDSKILDHRSSGIFKYNELQKFAFNLCPENSMSPGYYTEKIPEAFMAACLPITWVDQNICVDFNPAAILNLAPMQHNHFLGLRDLLESEKVLAAYAEQPLLFKAPTIEPFKKFVETIVKDALS